MLRYKSAVWRYFSVSADTTKAMCHLCGKLLSRGGCGKSASTSPLSAHLKSMHRKEYDARDDGHREIEGCALEIRKIHRSVRLNKFGLFTDRAFESTQPQKPPRIHPHPPSEDNKMPDRCCIPDCRAISNKKHGKISLFRIPKNDTIRSRWLKSIALKDWNPGERAVVCEKHFDPSCISKKESYVDKEGAQKVFSRMRPVLVAGSLPTIFKNRTTTTMPAAKKKRRKRRKLLEQRRIRRKKGNEKIDSMPLQQRLNTISGNSCAPQEENHPLKSQPLSPTKLKVTRQSTSKSVQEATSSPGDSPNEEVCLRWNSHHSNMQSAFPSLLSKEQYCDVTLVADGKSLKCHKLILSSCSSYFDQVLEKIMPYQHPVIFMRDIPFNILKSLCDFMYAGEVNILQGDLDQLLAVAESLKIKGLANKNTSTPPPPTPPETKDPSDHIQQHNKIKEASSRFVKIAPKPAPSGVVDVKKFAPPKGGANGDVTDPLDLMEPTYEEEAIVDAPPPIVPKRAEPGRRSIGKRVRKRKHIGDEEHESSPPVFLSRKGTRSRPNVKVPRYFNASFDNSNDKPTSTAAAEHHHDAGVDTCADPLLDLLEEIKTEPVDIEDSLIEESYYAGRAASTRLTAVVAKQEKEDVADPLNVGQIDGRQHNHAEEDSNGIIEAVENSHCVERGDDAPSSEKLPLESSNNESAVDPEENSQVVLSIAGTFCAVDDLPENETS